MLLWCDWNIKRLMCTKQSVKTELFESYSDVNHLRKSWISIVIVDLKTQCSVVAKMATQWIVKSLAWCLDTETIDYLSSCVCRLRDQVVYSFVMHLTSVLKIELCFETVWIVYNFETEACSVYELASIVFFLITVGCCFPRVMISMDHSISTPVGVPSNPICFHSAYIWFFPFLSALAGRTWYG